MEARINMVGILTDNFEEMVEFYREVMGFSMLLYMEGNHAEFDSPGVRFAISSKKVMTEVTGHPSFAETRAGQCFELAFEVSSPEAVDESYAQLIEKGATEIKAPADMPWKQRTGFFADPDGNIHEVFCDLAE